MKSVKKEQVILNFIKYGPILFVLILSFIITQITLEDKKENFVQEIKHMEKTFLFTNKKRVKEEVEEVYNYVLNEKKNSEKLLQETIKSRVYEAHQIATNIFKNESNLEEGHNHSKQQILDSIKNALGGMIYNEGRGYIFMDDIFGTSLFQPLHKDLEGKNFLEFEDAKGYKFMNKIVDTIKNKTESFDTYYWYKADDVENVYKKISFYKYFEPLNIAIGTGEYIEDFENELKVKVLKRINEIRYGKAGYIFIYDLEGNCLSHYKKELAGKNRIDYQDKEGRHLVKEIVDFGIKNKEGYLSYDSSIKPLKSIENNSKISYIKSFNEWGWVIGTGFYTDTLIAAIKQKKNELESSNQKSIEKIIYISIFITFIFILISFYISRHIKKSFDNYKYNLNEEIKKTVEREQQLIQQSKMAVMGEMIGNITHQWKQPLSLISMSNGLIQLNQDNNEIGSKQEIDSATDTIENAVNHLSTTINDFRDFFKPNKQKEHFKIKDTLNKTYNLINSQFKNNNIEVHEEIPDIKVYAFHNELLQVLINIFKNAKDELVKLKIDKRHIFVDIVKNEKDIIITIKDNAGGISEEIISNVFDSHFTTKSDAEGTGIGLYMSKEIITNMSGIIEVKNVEFEFEDIKYTGAEFKIMLPLES
jgi:signal transduction histidine kinase